MFSDQFVIGWHGGDIKSDKKCALYDRKSEKAFRPLIDDFVTWLKSGDYGDEDGYGDEAANLEEEKGDDVPEVAVSTETED